jgi:hypothetical protein
MTGKWRLTLFHHTFHCLTLLVVESLQSIVVRIGAFHVASLLLSLVATYDVVIVNRFFELQYTRYGQSNTSSAGGFPIVAMPLPQSA